MSIVIMPLTQANFRIDSLDSFIRHQEINECWRNVDGEWQLCPVVFTEDWDRARLRSEAEDILRTIGTGLPVIGALDGERVVGYAQLGNRLGKRGQYVELVSFHVSAPYRGQGIGRRLFAAICDAARALGAHKLYISAHSSKESQAVYRALGCVHAEEPDAAHVVAEPCDVQMEYDLKEQPPMHKGRIIFLNGVTSSGKTSIVEALQNRTDCYFYVVANDLFEQMIGDRFLQENYWQHLSRAILLMYHTAKLFSDMGHDVLIDGILVERPELAPHYEQLMDILADNPLSIVEVACPLEVCRARNIARGDRYETQSDEQAALMTKGIEYALTVETDRKSPEECADAIVRTLINQEVGEV